LVVQSLLFRVYTASLDHSPWRLRQSLPRTCTAMVGSVWRGTDLLGSLENVPRMCDSLLSICDLELTSELYSPTHTHTWWSQWSSKGCCLIVSQLLNHLQVSELQALERVFVACCGGG